MTLYRLLPIILIAACLFPESSAAWNYVGHVVAAEIAYENLTPAARSKADKLASFIYNELPISQQAKLDRHYLGASVFAKIAMLPDTWKKQQVRTIFNYFHAPLPLNLLFYAKDKTSSWHFINKPYPSNTSCNTIRNQNIIWALDKITNDLSSGKVNATNAVLMVFMEHLTADINQPLHVMTNVTKSCLGDGGGSTVCLKNKYDGTCAITLHTVWDSGAGYLKPKRNILFYASSLQQTFPRSQFIKQGTSPSYAELANMNYQYAGFIYSFPANTKPSADYYRRLQVIAKAQLVKAGYILADELNKDLG